MKHPVTLRELEVFTVYCQADTLEDAGVKLGISPQTVKNTLTTLYRKLDCTNARQVAWRLWGGETVVIQLDGLKMAVKVM